MSTPHFNARAVAATYLDFGDVVEGGQLALTRALERLGGKRLFPGTRTFLTTVALQEGGSARERYQRRFDLEHAVGELSHLVGERTVLVVVLETLLGLSPARAQGGADLLVAGVHPGRVEGVLTRLPGGTLLSEADLRFVVESGTTGVPVSAVVDTLTLVVSAGLDGASAEVAHRLVLDGTVPQLAVSAAERLVRC